MGETFVMMQPYLFYESLERRHPSCRNVYPCSSVTCEVCASPAQMSRMPPAMSANLA